MRDNQHNISHWMLGKRDLKGRLLSDHQKEEIRDARWMSLLLNQPKNPGWQYFIEKAYREIEALRSESYLNALLDELDQTHPDFENMTFKEMYLIIKEKLDAERKAHVTEK